MGLRSTKIHIEHKWSQNTEMYIFFGIFHNLNDDYAHYPSLIAIIRILAYTYGGSVIDQSERRSE